MLGLLPAIMIFRVPLTGFGISTMLVAVIAACCALQITRENDRLRLISPAMVFVIYIIAQNKGNGAFPVLYLLSLICIFGSMNGAFDFEVALKTIRVTALLATYLLYVQLFAHYLLGINIRTLYDSMVLPDYARSIGYVIKGGLFRPSGFFLEPSHYAQYTIIALLAVMREEKLNKWELVMFASGMVASTSGIGILLLAGAFAYLVFERTRKVPADERAGFIIALVVAIAMASVVALQIPMVKMSLDRVFATDSSGYNAVDGRSVHWDSTVGSLRGSNLIWGVGPKFHRIQGFITGLNEIIYYYGYLGITLMYLGLLYPAIYNLTGNIVISVLCVVYGVLITTSDVVGFINITFWLSLTSHRPPIERE